MRASLFALCSALSMACLATALAACEASVKEGCVGGVCNTGGAGAGGAGAGNSGNTGGAGGAGGDDACAGVDREGELPCEVRAVLEAKCWGCHGSPLANAAPFPLVTYADTQAEFSAGVVIWERMQLAVESGFMPFSGSADGPLTDDELDVLDDWFDACAPSAADGCDGP